MLLASTSRTISARKSAGKLGTDGLGVGKQAGITVDPSTLVAKTTSSCWIFADFLKRKGYLIQIVDHDC